MQAWRGMWLPSPRGKVSRITKITRAGTRLIVLKTGGMLHVGMGRPELGSPGQKCERAVEAGKHARRVVI